MGKITRQLGLLAVILLTALPALAYDFEADGIYYNITSMSNLEVEVTYESSYYSSSYKGDITIPETVSNDNKTFTVTGIGNYAFDSQYNSTITITSVTLPQSIKTIGSSAFCDCNGLEGITLPDNVETIGSAAFEYCTSLKRIIIPASVKSIKNSAFCGCSSLIEVFFLSPTKPSIASNAFSHTHSSMEQYVPSKEAYGFGIEYVTFTNSSYEYNGGQQSIEWQNNLKAYKCNISTDGLTETAVGTYTKTVTATYSDGLDLTVEIPYSYEITKAPLTVTVNNAQREYGEQNPTFSSSVSGLASTDSELSHNVKYSCEATKLSSVGTYRILATLDTSNYNVTYSYGTLTIAKAPLKIAVKNTTMTYGSSAPQYELIYTGLKNNEAAPTWTTKPTVSSTASKSSSVGEYTITAKGGVAKNYDITEYTSGIVTVTKKTLTAKVTDCERYYGEDNPTFTLSYSGFANNDTKSCFVSAPTATCSATSTSDAGEYAITLSGGEAENYNFVYQNGTLTVKPLSVDFKSTYNTVTYNDMTVSTSQDYFKYIPDITGPFSGGDIELEMWFLDKDNIYSGFYAGTVTSGSYAGNYVNYDGPMYAGKYIFTLTKNGRNPNVVVGNSRAYVTVSTAQTDLKWNASSPITVEVGETVDLGITYQADLWCVFNTNYDESMIQLSQNNSFADPHWYVTGVQEGETTLYFDIDCRKNDMGCYDFYDSSRLSKRIKVVASTLGIDEVDNGEAGSVRVVSGKLVFDGFDMDTNVRVYATSGALVFNGKTADVPTLSAGLYIVKVSNKTFKIAVR